MSGETVLKAASTASSSEVRHAISTSVSTVGNIARRLPRKLELGWAKTVLLVSTLASLLASCAPGMSTTDLQNFQGKFSGVDGLNTGPQDGQSMPHISGSWRDDFTYDSAVDALVEAAKARGVSDEDINLALSSAHIDVRLSVLSQTQGANATIETHPSSDKKHTPATLSVVPSSDGVFNVVVAGQECLVGQDICTQPTTFSLNITVDNSPPVVSLSQPTLSNGILSVGANIADASGIQNVSANTCGDTTGTGKQPLAVENNGAGQYSILIKPTIGEVICVEAQAIDSLGNVNSQTARSPDKYSINTSLIQGKDVDENQKPTGTLNFTPSGSASFGVPVSLTVQACDGSPLNGGVMNNGVLTGVIPPPGPLCAESIAVDAFGNKAISAQVISQNDLTVASSSIVQQGTQLHIEGKTQTSSGIPAINVVVESCATNEVISTFPITPDTGGFIGDFAPVSLDDNCIRVAAVDKFNQIGPRIETHGQYTFPKPEVSIQFNPKDSANMFIYINAPQALPETISVDGEQPVWKRFGAKGHFDCTGLGMDGLDSSGRQWQFELSCYLPAGNVGSPSIHLNMMDKNGFSLQVQYPLDANFTVPLREDPSLWEEASYFGPLLAALLLALSVGTGAGIKYGPKLFDYLNESIRASAISDISKQALTSKDDFLALKKSERSPRRYADEIILVKSAQSAINSKIPPRPPERIKRQKQQRGEDFRAQQIQELERAHIHLLVNKTMENLGEWHTSPHIDPLNARYTHSLFEGVKDVNTIYVSRVHPDFEQTRTRILKIFTSKLKEWIYEYVDTGLGLKSMIEVGTRFGLTGDTLQLLLDLQTDSKYEKLWRGIQTDDLLLARKMREITICYAASTKIKSTKDGRKAETIIIDIPHIRKKLLSKLVGEKADVDEKEIIRALTIHKLSAQIEEVIQVSRSTQQKTSVIEGLIEVRNIDRAVALLVTENKKTSDLSPMRKKIISFIAQEIQKTIYNQLPDNRKFNSELIREKIRVFFRLNNRLKLYESLMEEIGDSVQKLNMQQH